MENRFEILLDCKNNHVDMLLKDLEDAEEQNLRQYGAHVQIISQFLGMYIKFTFNILLIYPNIGFKGMKQLSINNKYL